MSQIAAQDGRSADLTGRTCLVTGANRGIGLATSLELARAGAGVVLVCRDQARAEAAAAEVRRLAGTSRVEYLLADLSGCVPRAPGAISRRGSR